MVLLLQYHMQIRYITANPSTDIIISLAAKGMSQM
jgi:hypothetical protein